MKLPVFWPQLPEAFRARLSHKYAGRQRAMCADGHLLLVLHKVPETDSHEREMVLFWRRPDGTWDSSAGGGLLKLAEHVESFEEAEEELARAQEEATDAQELFDILERVVPVLHSARNLQCTLQAGREAVPQDRDLIDLRDRAYEIERTLDLIATEAKHAIDHRIAMQAEEESRLSLRGLEVANRLNLLAAIFFPLTALASILSMNLRSGLEESPVWVFWLVLAAGVVFGIALSSWAMRGAIAAAPPKASPRAENDKARRRVAR